VTAAAWRLVWEWAGSRGEATDINPQWTEVARLYDGGASRRQVEVSFRPRGLSVAALVEAGAHPHSGRGSLYLGDRLIIASRWVEASYDIDGEPLTVTLSESPDDDRGLWPPIGLESRIGWDRLSQVDRARRFSEGGAYLATGKIDATAWPSANSSAIGQGYPIVVGSPGSTTAPAVPAYGIAAAGAAVALLVSGARASGSVRVWGIDNTSGATPTMVAAASTSALSADTDGYGTSVTLTSINHASEGLDYSDGSVMATSWESAAGLPAGAGSLLQMIASASTARLDVGSFGGCASFLDRYRFDGYFDQRTPALGLIGAQFLPLLPASIVTGADGAGLVIWPWIDGAHHAVAHLVEGPGFARASRVTYRGEPLSSVVFSYGYDIARSAYTRRKVITPDASAHARHAMMTAGESADLVEIESRLVWDDASASRMLSDRMTQLAMPRRELSFIADAARYGSGGDRELQIGMAVDLTDTGLRLSRRAAVVSAIERSATSLRITCTLRDDALSGR
jgi:hypothetical protein